MFGYEKIASEKTVIISEFPTRYQLDEARFSGGSERIRSKEAKS